MSQGFSAQKRKDAMTQRLQYILCIIASLRHCVNPPLEPFVLVHHVAQRTTLVEPQAVVYEQLGAPVVHIGASARHMGRDQDSRGYPQWMLRRQRLHLEHVQPSPGDLPRLKGCRQASSFTVAPRPMLMKKADLFIARNCSRPNIPWVSGVSGTVAMTISPCPSAWSRSSGR